MESMLKITNIRKEYDKVVALDDVNLDIEQGDIFGLLGPNGAGKTTLIRILTGITLPDQGTFTLNGVNNTSFDSLSRMIGYLPEERGMYKDMKIIDQLEYLGRIKGLKKKEAHEKINFYAEKFEIVDWLSKKASELSKGMQQMVQFMATIFFEPRLIILDEPFTGLDPINSKKLQDEILNLQKEGKTIIFSTHRMEQVEEFCENIALINKGKIILEGKIADIKDRFKKNLYKVEYSGKADFEPDDGIEVIEKQKNYVILKTDPVGQACMLDNNGINERVAARVTPTSENVDERVAARVTPTGGNALLQKILPYIEIRSFSEILPTLSEIFIEQVQKYSAEHGDCFTEEEETNE